MLYMHYISNYISVFYKNATENILKCVFKHFLLHLENWGAWDFFLPLQLQQDQRK